MTKYTYINMDEFKNINSKDYGWVYLCETPMGYKIGKSVNPKGRMAMLSREHNEDVKVIHVHKFKIDEYSMAEAMFHDIFREKNNGYRNEYFDFIEDDILDFINADIHDDVSEAMVDRYEEEKRERIRYITRDVKKSLKRIHKLEEELKKERRKLIKESNRMSMFHDRHNHRGISAEDIENNIELFRKTL